MATNADVLVNSLDLNNLSKNSIGPAFTRGLIEPPKGEKKNGSWTMSVYTKEQQARLNVNEYGECIKNNCLPQLILFIENEF